MQSEIRAQILELARQLRVQGDIALALMSDENALQYGSNAGAIMNEVAAATRRVIEGLTSGTIVPHPHR